MTQDSGNNASLTDAAVLVPVYRGEGGGLRVVIVRRSDWGPHGGQLAFPGGKRIDGESLIDAAIRETHEEIGLSRDGIEILDELPTIETHVSGFLIHPFLARVTPLPKWRRDPVEIEEVLDLHLDELADPDLRGSAVEEFPEWPEPIRIEFFTVGPHRLWGATFRILDPLIPRLLEGEWGL